MKNVSFVPKDVQRILSSHKFQKSIFYITNILFYKHFTIFQHLRWNLFFNKNRPGALLKKDTNTGVFFENIEKFLRIPILKNICEWLLLRVSLERFPTWRNNIGIEEDVFSKTIWTKLALSWCSLSFCFSLSLRFTSGGICST